MHDKKDRQPWVNRQRRTLLRAAGGGIVASMLGGGLRSAMADETNIRPLRWGIVGTGGIANAMARMIGRAEFAQGAAVSSRRMESAQAFAAQHSIGKAFDSWQDMAKWDGVDAIYIATPTSVREEIAVHAATHGKHVLGEKPFANLASLQRIVTACNDNDVAFMDGTHFAHHARTARLRGVLDAEVGEVRALSSAFQFALRDRGNIRYQPDLEPYGAIGDAGWYNMRAAVEYLAADVDLTGMSAFMRRDKETGAAVSASGAMQFSDGSTSTWICGFDAAAVVMDIQLTGERGIVSFDDFLTGAPDGSASYRYRSADTNGERIEQLAATSPGPVLMFDNFAAAVSNPALRQKSIDASMRTQRWLDAAWTSALANEAELNASA